MNEKAPTRQVEYKYSNETVTPITQPIKWINPEGKTVGQVLLEIGREIYECRHNQQDVEDLLLQAHDVLWCNFPNPGQNPLYQFIEQQRVSFKLSNKKSQRGQKMHLEDVAKESRFRIEHYFEVGDK